MYFTIPETGFVRLAQILTVIPVGKTCWWEGVRSGRYPKPVKLSPRCTAWRAEDIHLLILQIAEQSRPSNESRAMGLFTGVQFADEVRKVLDRSREPEPR
jgi:prophage regulatory protein